MGEISYYMNECAKNYKRLSEDQLDDEGVLLLLEHLHAAINEEMDFLAKNAYLFPKDDGIQKRAVLMEKFLVGDFYNAISLGRGEEVLEKFRREIEANKNKHKKKPTCGISSAAIPTARYRHISEIKDVREKMAYYRELKGIDIPKMSAKSGVSEQLLRMVERGHVTHPLIAKKIQKAYELTDEEVKELVPEIHREEEGLYDPDRYKLPENYYSRIPIVPTKKDVIDLYMKERRETAARTNDWKGIY